MSAPKPAVVALAWIANVVAAAAFVVAGAHGLAGEADRIDLGALGGLGPASLGVDALSGLFLVISFGVAIPALAAAAAPANRPRPRLAAAVAVVLAAVAVIVTADNLFVLLFGWEALTVAFYLLAGYDRDLPGRASASVATVVFGKASGAALLAGALLLAARTHTFAFSADGVDEQQCGRSGRLRAAVVRVRDQGRPCSRARLAAARLCRRPRTGAGGDGRCRGQCRLLRDVAHPAAARCPAGVAGLRGARSRRRDRDVRASRTPRSIPTWLR